MPVTCVARAFYAEFDDVKGPVVLYEEPPGCLTRDEEGRRIWECFGDYVITGREPLDGVAVRARAGRDNAGFLEAPAELEARSDSSGSDTESDDPDDISDGEKAEILAIGKNMIRKKDRVRFFVDGGGFFFFFCAFFRRRRRASGFFFFRSLVDARRRSTFFSDGFSVFRFFRSPLSRAGEDDLSLENNRHRLNLDGRSSECPGT